MKHYLPIFLLLATPAVAQVDPGHQPLLTWDINLKTPAYLGFSGQHVHGDEQVYTSTMGLLAGGITYDPTTDQVFLTDGEAVVNLYAMDPRTHAVQSIGPTGLQEDGVLACHPATGVLYFCRWDAQSMELLDKTTGAMISSTPLSNSYTRSGLAFHPTTHALYGVGTDGTGNSLLYQILQGSGPPMATVPTDPMTGIAFAADGTLYGLKIAGRRGRLVTIDLQTGATTDVCTYSPTGWFSSPLLGLTFLQTPAPELVLQTNPPVGGQVAEFELLGGPAEADTWITWSTTGPGTTPVAPLGITLGIASPLSYAGPMPAGPEGRRSFSGMLPPTPGVQVWAQTAQVGTTSDVLSFTIQ